MKLPVQYITFGEQLDAVSAFNGDTFVQELLSE